MSLATTSVSAGAGAGAGAGAVAMAHQPHAVTQHAQGPKVTTGPGGEARSTAAPRSASGLAADLVDKTINPKLIRNSKLMPIVCMDLYGEGDIAYAAGEGMAKEELGKFITLGTVGESKTDLCIKRNDEVAYRAVRKLLSKGEKGEGYYNRTLAVSISTEAPEGENDKKIANITRPHLLLGARRLSQLHKNTLALYPHSPDDLKPISEKESLVSAAIQQFDDTSSETGVAIRNQSLDGSSPPSGIDFDRVAFQLDLLPKKKKPLAILPDEAVSILLAKARHLVESDIKIRFPEGAAKIVNDPENEDDEENKDLEPYLNYPMALAVPGWHMSDASVESHLEAILGAGSEGMVYHRCVAALAGALLPRGGSEKGKNRLRECLQAKQQETLKLLQEKKNSELRRNANGIRIASKVVQHDFNVADMQPFVIAMGVTEEGIEGMACQLSQFQNAQLANVGKFKTLSEVSSQHDDPISLTEYVLEQIVEESVHILLPEDNLIPCAIVTFGNSSTQEKLKAAIHEVLKSKKSEWGIISEGNNKNVPILSTRSDVVAMGACALAAGSHGRITNKDGKKVTTTLINASTCAVGIRYMFYDDDKNQTAPDSDNANIKIIYEFDRQVPAGPYTCEFTAAECAAFRAKGKDNPYTVGEHIDEDEVKKFTGRGKIPLREEAARAFKIQVVQKCGRDGDWVDVGDVMEPLHLSDEDDDDNNKKIAIESSFLEISLGASGLIMTKFSSDRKSVVEATKSAFINKTKYYVQILLAILFFGGFLVKSYVEERFFERDVAKLLDYYKHVLPDSLHDGDIHHARYMVYKYRNKKDKLWKVLETKYGIPVSDDYSHLEDNKEEEVVELDDDGNEEQDKENEESEL